MVDQGREFYIKRIQECLGNNCMEIMYSTHNEGESVIAERFILLAKIYKKLQLMIANLVFVI